MGSLVPGWDAELMVPRELAPDADQLNIDKEPEPEGYFARLKSHRLSHGGPESPSLARISAPQALARSSTVSAAPGAVARSATGPLGRSSTGIHATPAQQFPFRSTSLSYAAGHHPEITGRHRLPHHEAPTKYPFTDWTEELTTLRQGPPRHAPQIAHDEKHTGHCPEEIVGHEKRGAAWWRALEVGQLNEHPDAAAEAEAEGRHGAGGGHATFVPQFTPQHHLDFGERGGGDGGGGGGGETGGEIKPGGV